MFLASLKFHQGKMGDSESISEKFKSKGNKPLLLEVKEIKGRKRHQTSYR